MSEDVEKLLKEHISVKNKLKDKCTEGAFSSLTDDELYWSYLWELIPKERLPDYFIEAKKRGIIVVIGNDGFILKNKTGVALVSMKGTLRRGSSLSSQSH
jgi:hypothetical protein